MAADEAASALGEHRPQRGEHPGSGQALVGLWSGSSSGASQHAGAELSL